MAFLAPIGYALGVGTAATATAAATGTAAAAIVGGLVVAGTAATIAGAAGAFNQDQPNYEIPSLPAPVEAPKAEEAVKAEEEDKLRRGYAAQQSTVLTGPRGLLAPAPTSKKSLLGE